MKSPNTYTTSVKRALTSGARSNVVRSFAFLLAVCPVLLCSCQSTNSGSFKSNAASNNPYAKYEPKTEEEEAYYRDVYSGEWREQTDPAGIGKSIAKKQGTTSLPPHWQVRPDGARDLADIRSEASRRKTNAALSAPLPPAAPAVPSLPQPTYASAPIQTTYSEQVVQPNADVYAQQQAAAQQQAYAEQQAAAQQAYAQQQLAAQQQAYAQQQAVAQQAYAQQQLAAQQQAYAQQQAAAQQAYAQQQACAQQQASAQSGVQPQAAAQQQAPVQSGYPQQAAPVQYTPSNYQGASVERGSGYLFDEKVVVRGQEPVEAAPAVEVKKENVTAKVAEKAVVALDESRVGGVKVKPNIVDPSLAAPYANIRRAEPNPSAPANTSAPRGSQEEYVVTGGDAKGKVVAHEDWLVENLDPEDSAAHFDTVDGRILTEPSNRVFLYAPRFGAVRQIVAPVEGEQRTAVDTAATADGAIVDEKVQNVDVSSQDVKLLGATGTQEVAGAESAMAPTTASGRIGAIEADGQLRLHEMLTQAGVDSLGSEDSALLMDGAVAAQGWSDKKGVAVATDQTGAHANVYLDGPASVYAVKDGTVTSKLRIIKIANKDSARPGEFVEFTLRFENIGDQPLGNVTILDNLSSRLRYVDGTAKSSVKADFLADLSETGSLVLRWEVSDPLEPKEFGVVRFICKVQ